MADAIRLILTNVPAIMFIAALIVPTLRREGPPATRYLAWLLLLSVGVTLIWAGFFHVFFPEIASASIGWQVSPFEFEIGVADIAIGITAVIAFWQGFAFRAAVVCYIVLFNIGVAIGHVREAIVADNYAPGNFGVLLLLTVVQAVLLPILLWKASKERR